MTSRIDDFKAQIGRGFGPARANRYRVFLPKLEFATPPDTLDILCDSVTMPGRQITTTERFTDMKARKVPYAFAAEDVEISFILTNDWSAWTYLNYWNTEIIENVQSLKNFKVRFKESYAKDVEIEHLNYNSEGKSQIAKRVLLQNAFPTTLNSVELGNGVANEVIRVSASFSYDNWTQKDIRNIELNT